MKNSEFVADIYTKITDNLSSIIIGQKDLIDNVIITLFSNAHSIIVGVPGLAKTLTVKLLSEIIDMDFNRIQFTPDLMPSDITGTIILRKNDNNNYEFVKGPVFTNILLADEINRTPPKTQSALLQAMEERIVTAEGKEYKLPEPFNVFATQNPIEQEGTYSLPEAQLDRFMFQIDVSYPSKAEELIIISDRRINEKFEVKKGIIKKDDVLKIQSIVNEMPVGENIHNIITEILYNSRPETSKIDNIKKYIQWGASPRAGMYILVSAKVRALINGRLTPDKEDIKYVTPLVLKHRLILSFKGEMENIKKEDLINEIIKVSI